MVLGMFILFITFFVEIFVGIIWYFTSNIILTKLYKEDDVIIVTQGHYKGEKGRICETHRVMGEQLVILDNLETSYYKSLKWFTVFQIKHARTDLERIILSRKDSK